MNTLQIKSTRRIDLVDITSSIGEVLSHAGVKEGLCHVFVPHTTAGITLNECADPDVIMDLCHALDRLVPFSRDYRHREGNADAHIKATLVGNSLLVPIRGGSLALGTWQGIIFCEFDGPRSRKVHITVLGNHALDR